MKALLWCVLVVAVLFNVSTSFAFDGVRQVLFSVGSGVVVLGSAVGLFLMRTKRA
ncbi:hypothetical protein ACWCO0_13960 [Streptomyces tubercidicus]|uniref:Uncharacterized protein n=1 Tax=Streptomyces tubercidicus TaxID=47759 RepID=A0A640URP2_9ACTN|nr:hypothetical protein [Streptomyces tubercidicus]WAU12832.1 hypothetical protein STRTU_003236 [Streptomyces tubercidicus]GFE38337.1 hypothetical protein Stube_30100 [Streptomyces tubercidicus]